MKIFIIEPIGKKSDYLFQTMGSCFNFVEDIRDADWVFYDLWCGWGNYDANVIKSAVNLKKPVAVFDCFDYNDRVVWKGFSNYEDVKHEHWAYWLICFLSSQSVKVYFMRKMNVGLKYPLFIKPIEHIIQNDYPVVSKEELFNRPYDFCWIGNTSPERESVVNSLLNAGFNGYVHWTNKNGKIPNTEWVEKHKEAKLFLTSDGGGFSDERSYQLFSIAAMLKQKNNHFQKHPFTNGNECREVGVMPSKTEMQFLRDVLDVPENLYSIYISGIEHMRKYYSPESRASYILSTLQYAA